MLPIRWSGGGLVGHPPEPDGPSDAQTFFGVHSPKVVFAPVRPGTVDDTLYVTVYSTSQARG